MLQTCIHTCFFACRLWFFEAANFKMAVDFLPASAIADQVELEKCFLDNKCNLLVQPFSCAFAMAVEAAKVLTLK